MAGVNIGELHGTITLDDQFSSQLQTVQANLGQASKAMVSLGAGAVAVGAALTAGITLPLIALAKTGAAAFIRLDTAMTSSLAIMGDVSSDLRAEMEQTAMVIGRTTTISAEKAAQAYYFLASAGLSATESMAALPKVAQFAQAGLFDMERATELLMDAQIALGLRTGDLVQDELELVRVSDVLVKANALANGTVEQFADSLTNKAAGALKLVGKEIEEGVAVLAAFASAGVKGTLAGEKLNIMLRDLQTAAIKHGDVFKEMGIAVFDAGGEMRNVADILQDMEKAFVGLSDEGRRAALMALGFQDRSVAATASIIGMSDAIRRYEKELRAASGFTEQVAGKQLEAISARWTIFKERVEQVAMRFGAVLEPAMKKVLALLEGMVGAVERVIEAFGKLPEPLQATFGLLVLIVGLLGPALVAFGVFSAGLGAVAGLLSKNTVLAAGFVKVLEAFGATGLFTGGLAGIKTGIAAIGAQALASTTLVFGLQAAIIGLSAGAVIAAIAATIDAMEALENAQKSADAAVAAGTKNMAQVTKILGYQPKTIREAEQALLAYSRGLHGMTLESMKGETVTQAMVDAWNKGRTASMLLGDETRTVVTNFAGLNSAAKSLAGIQEDLVAKLAAARKALAALTDEQRANITAGIEMNLNNEDLVKELNRLKLGAGVTAQVLDLFRETMKDTSDEAADFAKSVKDVSANLVRAAALGVPMADILEMYGGEVENIVKQAPFFTAALTEPIERANAALHTANLKDQLADIGKRLDAVAESARKIEFDRLVSEATAFMKALDRMRGFDAMADAADHAKLFRVALMQVGGDLKRLPVEHLRATFKTMEDGITAMRLAGLKIPEDWRMISQEVGGYLSRLDGPLQNIMSRQVQLQLMNPFGKALTDAPKAASATELFNKSLDKLSTTFSEIAQIAGGALSDLARMIGEVLALGKLGAQAGQSMHDGWKNAGAAFKDGKVDAGALAGGLADVAAGALAAVAAMDAATNVAGKLNRTMRGAATGAQIGGSIYPGWGHAIGAIVGGLIGAFRNPRWEDTMERVGTEFGAAITRGMAERIEADAKDLFGGNRQAAKIFNLAGIVAEGGGLNSSNIKNMFARFRDLFTMLQTGAFSAAEAVKVLDDNFRMFSDFVTKNGSLAGRQLIEIIRLSREAGLESDAVNEFVATQANAAVAGLQRFADARGTIVTQLDEARTALDDLVKDRAPANEIDEARKKVKELTSALAAMPLSAASALGIGASLAAVFGELLRQGMPVTEILKQLGPLAQQLADQFAAAGVSGGAAFDEMRRLAGLAASTTAGPAIEAVAGLNEAFNGLHNAGLLTQEMFGGLATQVADTFNALIAQGVSVPDALALMQPTLQTIWELQKDFGYAVDESTQALLTQAEAEGKVGETHRTVQEQMLLLTQRMTLALEGIATLFGVTLVDAVGDFGDAINDIPDPVISPRIDWPDMEPPGGWPEYPGGDYYDQPDRQGYASGTHGRFVNFGRETPVDVHGLEAIVPYEDRYAAAAAWTGGSAGPAPMDYDAMSMAVLRALQRSGLASLGTGIGMRDAMDRVLAPHIPEMIERNPDGVRTYTNKALGSR